jgi:hypothetical protein
MPAAGSLASPAAIQASWARTSRMCCHHLVQDGAQREDVRPVIRLAALELLRRHVLQRADDDALRRERGTLGAGLPRDRRVIRFPGAERDMVLREAEVQQLRAAPGQHHVARLEVAVDDALAMRGFQGARNLLAVTEDLVHRERAALQAMRERLAVQVLHDQEGADVRVLERRDGARLPTKTLAEPGIGSERRRQHLDGDRPFQAAVARLVNFAHPARTERAHDLVRAEPCACRQAHVRLRWRGWRSVRGAVTGRGGQENGIRGDIIRGGGLQDVDDSGPLR